MVELTRDSLNDLLDRNDKAVGRALVVLFKRQTEAEKQENVAKIVNNLGFTKADAFKGSVTAKYFLKHGSLQDWQLNYWRARDARGSMRIGKYWNQLADEAVQKLNAKATEMVK